MKSARLIKNVQKNSYKKEVMLMKNFKNQNC